MAAMGPDILGHIDLITKFNEGTPLFDESSPRYRAAALVSLNAAQPAVKLLGIKNRAKYRG